MELLRMVNALWAIFPLLLVALAWRPLSQRELDRFTSRYGVTIVAGNLLPLGRAVVRSRWARLVGAALGLSILPVLRAFGGSSAGWRAPLLGVVGYLSGALVAAMVPLSRTADGPRRASLTPRCASDYLPTTAILVPAATAVLGIVAVGAYIAGPHRADAPGGGGLYGALAVAAAAAVITMIGTHAVVRRPQPASSTDVVAADDAFRAHAVHAIAGAGIAIQALAIAAVISAVAEASRLSWLRWACLPFGLGAVMVAIRAWLWLRPAPWQVRRAQSA